MDKNQTSPIGFDIIFPGMLEYANDLGLKLSVDPTVLDTLLKTKAEEIKRYMLLISGLMSHFCVLCTMRISSLIIT